MRWLDDAIHFKIFLLLDWKKQVLQLALHVWRKKKISNGPSFMLGITAAFWKLTNVIWKFSSIILILIKCQMSLTAKLIPRRLKMIVLHLERTSQANLVHQHIGEFARLVDLKPSKQLITLEILLSALNLLVDRFILRLLLCGSRRGPSLSPLWQFLTSVFKYVQVHEMARVPLAHGSQWRAKFTLEKLSSRITFPREMNRG